MTRGFSIFVFTVFCGALIISFVTLSPVLGYYLLWQTPVRLPSPVNSLANEAYPCLNSGGDIMYFSSDRRHQVEVKATKYVTDWDIYRSFWNGSTWSEPENLVSINSRYSDSCPFLSSDGDYLYFASYRETGGQGKWDVYYSTRAASSWNAPINIGSSINSAANEISPSLSNDGLQLFFASDRSGGQGGFDIWVSNRADLGSAWQAPLNVTTVNSAAHDFAPKTVHDTSIDQDFLYLTSDRSDGPWDIYFAQHISGLTWSTPRLDFPPVNTDEADGYPFVMPERTMLLFVSPRVDDAAPLDVTKNGGLDIWYALPGAMTPTLDWRGIIVLMLLLSCFLLLPNLLMQKRKLGKVIRRRQ
ncbi:TolB family protein [candidate division CSSED10-310 bacterium]|uniref:TolB family protein n=1 Tax=candidate division CSSED10-310 bacterium TaxID=2855610 RepID=A0ABV6Z543_UNCC1